MLDANEKIILERRKRLAAERLLEQKSDELFEVNQKLAKHADTLSVKVNVQEKEKQTLLGEKTRVLAELDEATAKANQAERRLWDSLEAISDGFAVFDRSQRLVAANRAYMVTFDGIEAVRPGVSYEELLTICADEGIMDIGAQDPDVWIDEMLARWSQDKIPECHLLLFNGRHLRVEDRRTGDGDIVSSVADITDTIQREEALRIARDEAEAASRAKSAFLAKMSHEIRTPMNGVVGMADLLLDSALEEEQALFAQTIRNSSEALLVIINDILDFSKIEAGKLEFREEDVDIEELIVDVLRLAKAGSSEKDLGVFLGYPLNMPTRFVTDSGRLRQVLTNLIGNAMKFTEAGDVSVSVRGKTVPGSEVYQLEIAVEDTGIGIPEAKREHVFGEFNQVEDENNRSYEGTGLGLAITRGLVTQMGGQISVESEVDVGSCFTVTLPLRLADKPGPAPYPTITNPIYVCKSANKGQRHFLDRLESAGLRYKLLDFGPAPQDGIIVWSASQSLVPFETLGEGPILIAGHLGETPEGCTQDRIRTLSVPFTGAALLSQLKELDEQVKQAPASASVSDTGPIRLLAAEDNRTNQLVFRKMLKALNLDITMVENGAEALRAFAEGRFDMMFTDISMPEMDGKEATRRIRAMEVEEGRARLPIVAMTAHALEGDAEELFALGIDHYMTKPLKKAGLIAQIEALVPEGKTLQKHA